ncbi:hypothetical protein ASG31_11505 [Chryseobacterium sp. Leaf404]|uniref:hypothetical protein n=1 Tax=unclassified Chryseobacterium TaxID=2593645 RepID=UPI0006F3AE44|nr:MULTISPECIES: hypothetical protein [unclassified Chryseobacterium]KQT16984.1 hypothetical protein ASG31_11505 [Chryseobacterium sp. Leaf404]
MNIHFILPGETLEIISKKIKLENPVYLKEFHNSHCTPYDFIQDDLLPGRKLLIPDLNKVNFYNSRNDAPHKLANRNPKLSFNPENLKKKYRVSVIQTSETDGKKKISQFSYNIHLEWTGKVENIHYFNFSKTEINEQNQTKMSALAAAFAQSVNPIELAVSETGNLLEAKLNDEVKRKFHEIKSGLEDQFPDEFAKIYLDKFEFSIANHQIFNDKMKGDWFLKTYFAQFRKTFVNGQSEYPMAVSCLPLTLVQEGFEDDHIVLRSALKNQEDETQFTSEYHLYTENGIIQYYRYTLAETEFGSLYTTVFKARETEKS